MARVPENPTAMELLLAGNAYGEPHHILRKWKIGAKCRRKGIWQRDPDDDRVIYFTCPWCGVIGQTEGENLGHYSRDSVWCGKRGESARPNGKGCGRHLTLSYVDKPEETKPTS
jgi:hypothetical protein